MLCFNHHHLPAQQANREESSGSSSHRIVRTRKRILNKILLFRTTISRRIRTEEEAVTGADVEEGIVEGEKDNKIRIQRSSEVI